MGGSNQVIGENMSIILVTYDLKQPGRNYTPVHNYLRQFTHCKGMESVYLLDTTVAVSTIRDSLRTVVDTNDIIFVVRITGEWASLNYTCAQWLNSPDRNW
jgi:hypothetical protein